MCETNIGQNLPEALRHGEWANLQSPYVRWCFDTETNGFVLLLQVGGVAHFFLRAQRVLRHMPNDSELTAQYQWLADEQYYLSPREHYPVVVDRENEGTDTLPIDLAYIGSRTDLPDFPFWARRLMQCRAAG